MGRKGGICKNWEGSILQSVVMTTVKTSWNALYL